MADEYKESLGDEQPKPGGMSPAMKFANGERDRDIIEDAIKGMSVRALADKYNLSYRQMSRLLNQYAAQVREQASDLIAHAFHMQNRRLERLYELVEMELQAYEQYMRAVRAAQGQGVSLVPVKFDDRPFRVAVMIFDRQAKLLGMDKGRLSDAGQGGGPTGWLDGAPIEQVVNYAKQLKMNIPSQFTTD